MTKHVFAGEYLVKRRNYQRKTSGKPSSGAYVRLARVLMHPHDEEDKCAVGRMYEKLCRMLWDSHSYPRPEPEQEHLLSYGRPSPGTRSGVYFLLGPKLHAFTGEMGNYFIGKVGSSDDLPTRTSTSPDHLRRGNSNVCGI